jgi:hypothetical protein
MGSPPGGASHRARAAILSSIRDGETFDKCERRLPAAESTRTDDKLFVCRLDVLKGGGSDRRRSPWGGNPTYANALGRAVGEFRQRPRLRAPGNFNGEDYA